MIRNLFFLILGALGSLWLIWPKIITGKESATETYRSMAEVVRDMNKPEYQTDEAFRDDVIRKLSQSNLEV